MILDPLALWGRDDLSRDQMLARIHEADNALAALKMARRELPHATTPAHVITCVDDVIRRMEGKA